MTVRAAERAARDGGARRRPRAVSPVDPSLAERARTAMERLTGQPVRIRRGSLEVEFGDETGLAELVEVIERAVA